MTKLINSSLRIRRQETDAAGGEKAKTGGGPDEERQTDQNQGGGESWHRLVLLQHDRLLTNMAAVPHSASFDFDSETQNSQIRIYTCLW